ncbi:DUF4832 domain-containing protein [Capnocytophaga sp. HP1101]
MKKYFAILSVLLVLTVSCQSKDDDTPDKGGNSKPLPNDAKLTQVVSYKKTNDFFLNPERGFYTHQSSNDEITARLLQRKREEGINLFLTIYYLNDFRDKPISEAFLNKIRSNMRTIREGGAKVILRFAYTKSQSDKPWDAPWQWTEKHLEQLRPIIQENADVIAVWEAGFVGVWGEWYYTDNYVFKPKDNAGDYAPRKRVLEKLLSILPKDRMVAIRTPKAKLLTMGIAIKDSLTAQTAFNGSNLSRIGYHNDCFLADATDTGTFNNQEERNYLARETQYVVMGGETCKLSSYAECQNTLKEMATQHWSYLNMDYHQEVIAGWKNHKCMDEIKNRLGYRFVLVEGKFNENIRVGGKLQLQLKLKNEGFAAPYNSRDVQIVLVKKDGSQKEVFKVDADPRRWVAGKTITLGIEIDLPNGFTAGEYSVYLNFPDPYRSLANRPEYSIRLANENVWEARTGYNKINTIELKN